MDKVLALPPHELKKLSQLWEPPSTEFLSVDGLQEKRSKAALMEKARPFEDVALDSTHGWATARTEFGGTLIGFSSDGFRASFLHTLEEICIIEVFSPEGEMLYPKVNAKGQLYWADGRGMSYS